MFPKKSLEWDSAITEVSAQWTAMVQQLWSAYYIYIYFKLNVTKIILIALWVGGELHCVLIQRSYHLTDHFSQSFIHFAGRFLGPESRQSLPTWLSRDTGQLESLCSFRGDLTCVPPSADSSLPWHPCHLRHREAPFGVNLRKICLCIKARSTSPRWHNQEAPSSPCTPLVSVSKVLCSQQHTPSAH